MLHLICKTVHTSNLIFFSILATENCSRTKVVEITSRYLSSIKHFWQIPEKQNKCTVLSCFRAASTAAFKSQRNQQAEGSAIPTKRKMLPPATLLPKVMRTHSFRQLQWWRGPTAQESTHTGARLQWGRATLGQAQAHCPWDWMYARDFDPDDFTAKIGSMSQPLLFVWIQENLFREGSTQ